MSVVVRKRHTKKMLLTITGSVDYDIITLLYKIYGYENVEDDEKETINVEDTDWYQKRQKNSSPGETLKIYRENQEYTKKQIGEKIGQTARFITEIENGKRKLNDVLIKKFTKIFGMPESMLLPNR